MSFREGLDMQIAKLESEIAANPDDTEALELKALLLLFRDKAIRKQQKHDRIGGPLEDGGGL